MIQVAAQRHPTLLDLNTMLAWGGAGKTVRSPEATMASLVIKMIILCWLVCRS